MDNHDEVDIDYSDLHDPDEELANHEAFRAEMIEAELGDPDEWDWADLAATQAIDEARGK